METVVLSSVDIQGNWDTQPGRSDRDNILERCDKLNPGIKVATSQEAFNFENPFEDLQTTPCYN